MSDLTRFNLAKEGFKPFLLPGDFVACADLEGHEGAVKQYNIGITDGEYTYRLENVAFVPESVPSPCGEFNVWSNAKERALALVDKVKRKGIINLTLWEPVT